MPTVYVVVVNWNGLHHLKHCLPSLAAMSSPYAKVIVVDNNSLDGSQQYVREHFPDFILIQNKDNLGFAEANNIGMRYALERGAKYVALLNNDTRVEPDWLDRLIEVAEQDETIALCEAQQLTWDGTKRIVLKLRPDWLEGKMLMEMPNSDYSVTKTAYAAGCCVLIKCSVLDRIGLFDPYFFAYVEDVDLSLRAWIAGYMVLSVPRSIIYHRVAASSTPLRRMELGYKNQLYALFKNYEWRTLYHFRESIFARWVFTRNRFALRATIQTLRNVPYMLWKRQTIQKLRCRSDAEIFRLTGLGQCV